MGIALRCGGSLWAAALDPSRLMEVSLQVWLGRFPLGLFPLGLFPLGLFPLGLFLLGAVGCSSTAQSPPPPPEVEKEPEPPPPPPPKCEAIKEQCKAKKGTRVRITGTHYEFTPPKGWIYAQLEEAAVAQVGDEGPVVVLTTFELGQVAKERIALVKSFSELVLIEPPKLLRHYRWRARHTASEMAGLEMKLWELPGATRGEDQGALLVLSSILGERELFGLGFAPKDDEAGPKAILDALQSLAPGAQTEDDSGNDGSKDEGK